MSQAGASTWARHAKTPALRELVAVDQTGEPVWPFGREDVAGDGLNTFLAAEQAVDVRSAYVAAHRQRLWVRVYVSGEQAADDLKVYAFIDIDRNAASGGSARAAEIDPALDADRSAGGYEVALAIREGPGLTSVWRWSDAKRVFEELTELEPLDVLTEAGSDVDPLGLGRAQTGYLQTTLSLEPLALSVGCDVSFLFRSAGATGLADRDVGAAGPCRAGDANENGVSDLAEIDAACMSDDECPADGSCEDGRCRAPELVLGSGEAVEGGAFTCEVRPPRPAPPWGRIVFGVGLTLSMILWRGSRRQRHGGSRS